jgi:RNA polymerase sigma factor (sigma-70 family)
MSFGPKGVVLAKIFEADLENGRDYYNKMRGAAARTNSVGEDNADDFMQDFYLATLNVAEGYRYEISEDMVGDKIEGPLNTWLWWRFFGLRNEYNLRVAKRPLSLIEREESSEDDVGNSCLAYCEDVSSGIVDGERASVVLGVIDKLPSLLKGIIVLKYYIGKNATEIGEIVGRSSANVRMRLSEITKRLAREKDLAYLIG